MKWILAFHIIFVITWFAGLFYLPRLFVYHAQTTDTISNERFKIMERRLFRGIMTPSAILATLLGVWLILLNPSYFLHQSWMQAKLAFVVLLWIYHILCYKFLRDFRYGKNKRTHQFYRFFNEIPMVLLIVIVLLVILKPAL